jgi:serine/threonine-protein kinase
MASDPTKLHLEPFQGIESSTNNWYKHIEILGSGANAITALVISTSDAHRGTLFALKIFKRLGQPKRRQRFQAETEFLQKCGHPSVMRVFDTGIYSYTWGEHFDYPFIVAEYLPKTLAGIIQENAASLPEKVSYIMQLLSALDFLHSLQPSVIHRDIKPSNIFIAGQPC